MSIKKNIKEIIVVEGKSDSAKLKQLFNVNTIETNGLALTNKKINDIKKLSQNNGLIFFLDPDGPGEKIRKKLIEFFPNSKHCFISRNDIPLESKKIGVAEANDLAIIKALENAVTFNKLNESISWEQYLYLELDSKSKRIDLCNKLNISYCNHKQLFQRLNMLNLSFDDVLIKIKK